MNEFSVDTFQGFRERQDNVSARPIKDFVGENWKSEIGLARTFWGGTVLEGKDEGFLWQLHRDMGGARSVRRKGGLLFRRGLRWPRDAISLGCLDAALVSGVYEIVRSTSCPPQRMSKLLLNQAVRNGHCYTRRGIHTTLAQWVHHLQVYPPLTHPYWLSLQWRQ